MSSLLFTYVRSAERAKEDIEWHLDYWQDKQFFSAFEIGEVYLYENVFRQLLAKLRSEHLMKKDSLEKEIYTILFKTYPQGSQKMVRMLYGERLMKLGSIFAEEFCEYMPWYNILYKDWSLPTSRPDDLCPWYAVSIDFYR